MRLLKFFTLIIITTFFASCNFTENIYINEDGSGKMSFDVDASAIMDVAGDQMKNEKSMDSTFAFKTFFEAKKDSIAKLPQVDQERLKKMENFSVNMKMKPEEKKFVFSIFTNFKNTSELMDMMEAMKTIEDMKGKKKEQDPSNPFSNMSQNNTDLKFAYNGKTFSRKVKVKDLALQKTISDSLGSMKGMLAAFNYTIKYHFPKKVKSVSNKNALFSEDRKTITIEYPFTDYLEKPESLSFDVVLERK